MISISISTVVNTIIAFGGLRVAEEAAKQGIQLLKTKIGTNDILNAVLVITGLGAIVTELMSDNYFTMISTTVFNFSSAIQ